LLCAKIAALWTSVARVSVAQCARRHEADRFRAGQNCSGSHRRLHRTLTPAGLPGIGGLFGDGASASCFVALIRAVQPQAIFLEIYLVRGQYAAAIQSAMQKTAASKCNLTASSFSRAITRMEK